MRKYFIDEVISYEEPYNISAGVTNFGELKPYMGRAFNVEEMDDIICTFIKNHPYIAGCATLKVSISWQEGDKAGYYHILTFNNEMYKEQGKDARKEVRYERNVPANKNMQELLSA